MGMRAWSGLLLGLVACTSPDSGEAGSATTDTGGDSSTTPTSDAEVGGDGDGDSGDASSEGDGDADDTETGPACTGETCTSLLTLNFAHTLPLLEGPHRLSIQTPLYELICSVESSLEGSKTCFGYAFTDLSWTDELVTVEITNAFFPTDEYPTDEPFDTVSFQVERGDELLFEGEVSVEPGEAIAPDPCGPICWHATAQQQL